MTMLALLNVHGLQQCSTTGSLSYIVHLYRAVRLFLMTTWRSPIPSFMIMIWRIIISYGVKLAHFGDTSMGNICMYIRTH